MGYWRTHQKKDLERLLEEFHKAGWTIKDPPKYYRALCPCGDHKRWIHLTPSGANYARDTRAWLYRQPCYQEAGDN